MTDSTPPSTPYSGQDRRAPQDPAIQRAVIEQRRGGAQGLKSEDRRRDANPDEIDLLAYWDILVKRRKVIVRVLAGVVSLALLLTLKTQPLYRAEALMQVEKEGPPIVATQGAMPYYDGWDPEFLNTQYELLRSRALAERVANELNLSEKTLSGLNDPGWLNRVMVLLRPAPQAKEVEAAAAPRSSDALLRQATSWVQGGLTVSPVAESRLVRLQFDSPDPAFSVRVVNAVSEAFIASTIERRMGTTTYAKTYLEDQLKQTKSRLEQSERALVEFAQKENLVNTGTEGTSLATQNLTDLNSSLAAAQSQRIRAEARWLQASAGGAITADMLGASGLGALQQQRAGLLAQYQQKLQVFKADYPDMRQIKAQIDEISRQIAAEKVSVRASVKAEYDAATSQEGLLTSQINALRGQALEVDGRSIDYNILKREADTNRQLYDSLLQRFKEVGAAGDVRSNNISIIDRSNQGWRFKPNVFHNLMYGFLAGLLLGVLSAFVLEFLDDTLKTPEDVEQRLRLAVLGIIPKLGPKQSFAEVAADPRSAFSEAYRSVRTGLQFSTDHGVPRSLLITSPSASEGKSTTALVLARNFAQLGKRVLLIEGDLRNPSLHRMLGLPTELGLSNLLSGGSSLGDVTQSTDDENLHVILAGPLPPNPAELLSGSKFVSALIVASERYDQVIVDGPPVLGLADSPILANVVEGTLLVVTSGNTRISTAGVALKRLIAARAHLVGALLTKYDQKAARYSYYQYDAYYSYDAKPRSTKG